MDLLREHHGLSISVLMIIMKFDGIVLVKHPTDLEQGDILKRAQEQRIIEDAHDNELY